MVEKRIYQEQNIRLNYYEIKNDLQRSRIGKRPGDRVLVTVGERE